VTRGTKIVWILSIVVGLTLVTAFATSPVELDRLELWQVVRACVADFKLTGAPFPCLNVDLSALMFAVSSSRRENALLACERFRMAATGQGRRHDHQNDG
jgi:hypothetical protein